MRGLKEKARRCAVPFASFACPRGRDCFVARRAPRNDNIHRHCEPTGPAFGRPDDRLREAISLDLWAAYDSACFTRSGENGTRLIRMPVASKIALAMAAATGIFL